MDDQDKCPVPGAMWACVLTSPHLRECVNPHMILRTLAPTGIETPATRPTDARGWLPGLQCPSGGTTAGARTMSASCPQPGAVWAGSAVRPGMRRMRVSRFKFRGRFVAWKELRRGRSSRLVVAAAPWPQRSFGPFAHYRFFLGLNSSPLSIPDHQATTSTRPWPASTRP